MKKNVDLYSWFQMRSDKKMTVILLLLFCLSPLLAEPCGDVNSSGVIDIVDALMTAQYYVGLEPVGFDSGAADVDGDGSVNIVDALQLAQYYVGLITTLKGCEGEPATPDPCVEKKYVLEAEEMRRGDGVIESDHPGFTGSGYVNLDNAAGVWIQWPVEVSYAGNALCEFTYACASDVRSMDLSINGITVSSLGFPATGAWSSWSVDSAVVNLNAGTNTIRLTGTTSGGAPNLDKMDITICGDFVTPAPPSTPTPTPCALCTPAPGPEVGLYRTFEKSLTNSKSYSNKFTDVELKVSYGSPSGKTIDFFGFFDGDGKGGGSQSSGNVWKMRFMPDELGAWNYTWSWSDGTAGGQGVFNVVTEGAGKGILRPYKDNPRWFAYNGTEPVYLKSYYETGHGAIAQPFDWIKTYVYQPMLDRGYNHLQVNWLLPLCCDHQWYHDGPGKSIDSIRLYDEGRASSTMRFNVWYMMEEHVQWLNEHNVGLHMFLGFNGGRNDGPDWKALSSAEKEFYVKYVVARLAPYANIAGWNYVWETDGNDSAGDLGLARLLKQYDIFDHLRTYEDQFPADNEYDRPEYNFAAVENHGFSTKNEWGEAWTHHEGALAGYVTGKPVYMSEGNALWRRYWHKKLNESYGGVDQNDLRQSAWACVTAGASFCWNGHAGEDSLVAFGPEGLPFNNSSNPFTQSEDAITILTRIMNEEVKFYRMTPQDSLLSGHDSKAVWCLAETGQQYLVFASNGKKFSLNIASGQYTNNIWINAVNGTIQSAPAVSGGGSRNFTPPNTLTDWVLILRA